MTRRLLGVATTAHRWLGTVGLVFFALWFASGIVMMYAQMPRLDPVERARSLAPLDLSAATIAPHDAARFTATDASRVRIGMSDGRPAYRFLTAGGWRTVYADTGEPLASLERGQALALARSQFVECGTGARYDGYLRRPDQWSFQLRGLFPLHRVGCGDPDATVVYVSEALGEVVNVTDRRGRALAMLGAIPHWLYFKSLRTQSVVWARVVVWSSLTGALLALSGIGLGLIQLARARRSSLRATPYRGSLAVHHVLGLVFGLVTFTWALSGALSMDPWSWHSGTSPTRAQTEALSGGPLDLRSLTLDVLHEILETRNAAATTPLRELDVVQVSSKLYVLTHEGAARSDIRRRYGSPTAFLSPVQPFEPVLTSVDDPKRSVGPFPERLLATLARRSMRPHAMDAELLDRYDAFYADRDGLLPLPVLRTRHADSASTWLYIDPRRGLVLRKEERTSRLNRWLYRGLHRLDFPGLYSARPLWDIVTLVLLLGGLAAVLAAVLPTIRRWRRALRQRGS